MYCSFENSFIWENKHFCSSKSIFPFCIFPTFTGDTVFCQTDEGYSTIARIDKIWTDRTYVSHSSNSQTSTQPETPQT